jgi:eukaryotic-like serine/threonine-protein kinase
LHQVINEDGPLAPITAARVGLDVLDALTAAHRAGVLHRDVKPHNVLIGTDGRVVLTDFGLATFVDDGSVTGPGLVVGSPQYVSPERARDGASTVESDLWSLGATLYAAVEGRSPYARENAMATLMALATEKPDPPTLAGPLIPVLTGLLKYEPSERLTADEVEQQLRAIVAATGVTPPTTRSASARRVTAGRAAVPGQRLPVEDDHAPEAALATSSPEIVPPAPATAASAPAISNNNHVVNPFPPQRRPPVEDDVPAPPADPVPPRSRLRLALAGALIVVLLAGVGLLAGWLTRRGDDDRQATPPTVPTAGSSSGLAPAGFSQVECQRPASPSAPRTPQANARHNGANGWALPDGWSYFADTSGFQVAVPDGWTYERVGTTVCFRDPSNVRFLSVDPDRNPAGDPVQACRKEAARLIQAGELPQYAQVGIVPLTMQVKAADWEYTYDGPRDVRMHAITRWFASGGKAFALGWATRDFDWQINLSFRSMVVGSFSATGTKG